MGWPHLEPQGLQPGLEQRPLLHKGRAQRVVEFALAVQTVRHRPLQPSGRRGRNAEGMRVDFSFVLILHC